MSFALFILTVVTLYIRPGELFPGLDGLPIYAGLLALCVLGAHRAILDQLTWASLRHNPITLCLLGLVGAAATSHLSHFYFGGAIAAAQELTKSLVLYLVLVGVVNTPRKFRVLMFTVALSGVTMIALSVFDYYDLIDIPVLVHIVDTVEDPILEQRESVLRLCGMGLFGDPNDISMVIVATGMLCLYFFLDRELGPFRVLWLIPMGILAVGMLATHSRGGLIGFCGAFFVLILFRMGRQMAIASIVLAACVVPLIAGRQGNIDLESGTGQARIQAWKEGLSEIKSSNILFGIGMDEYGDRVGLVAHNSFVHAYVELGFLGGTLFFGVFFLAAVALYRLNRECLGARLHPELARACPFIAALLAGWGTAMLSLSRCYVMPTFLTFGTVAAYLNLAGYYLHARRPLVVWNRELLLRLSGCSAVALVGLFVFVKVFAV